MKNNFIGIAFICLVLVLGCKEKSVESAAPPSAPKPAPKILSTYHYVGAAQLTGNTNASQLRKIWAMPETVRFRNETLTKIAKASQEFFPKHGTNAAIGPSGWIRPLLDDLIQAESFGELRGAVNGASTFTLAIQLNAERAQIWSTNLWQAASARQGVTPVALTDVGSAGWEVQATNQTGGIRFLREGPWVVVTTAPAQTQSNLLAKIAAEGRPIPAATNYWFDADVDSRQLQNWLEALPIKNFPNAHVTVTGRGENLHTDMRLTFAEPLSWKYQPWQIPTNIIQNPANSLISFAAARGVASLLKDTPVMQKLEWATPPDQLFFWSQFQVPYRSYAAAPVANASNVLHEISPRLPSLLNTNLMHPGNGEIRWTTNHSRVVWVGLPFITPHLRPLKKPEGEFLVAGLFPPPPATNAPLPAELLASLSHDTNTCYYHWEITQERLYQWRSLYSLYYVIANLRPPSESTAGQQWLTAVSTNLGNSVTEMTVTSPEEMQFMRSSHLSLTGLEIVQLTHWIESTNFPHNPFEMFPVCEPTPLKRLVKPPVMPAISPPPQLKPVPQPKR